MRGDVRRGSTMKVPLVLCQSTPHTTHTPAPRVSRIASAPPTYSRTSQLAPRLQQNWLARHPTDTCSNGGVNLDDSLTSLSWLQNLNILKITSPTPPPSPPSPQSLIDPRMIKSEPPSPPMFTNHMMNHGGFLGGPPQIMKMEQRVPLADSPPLCGPLLGPDNVDYKTNPYVKPPYSYATLICMAMKETRKHKITLSAIYNWITDNFMYYRMADPSWQVSYPDQRYFYCNLTVSQNTSDWPS